MTVRVLSIDGGGIRGILPARVLVELEEITGRRIAELFDLIAGTATGGVLALGLTAPDERGNPRSRARDLLQLYLASGTELFPDPDPTHRLRHAYGLRPAKHPAVRPLADRFGETPLGDALVDVIVPAFDLKSAEPLLLRSDEFEAGLGPPMRDIALATSTMPTHFPPVAVELGARGWALTYGGVVAANPAPFAYAEALARGAREDLVLVSLGTGARATEQSNGSAPTAARWPALAARAFELQQEGSSEAQHQLLNSLLAATGGRERYWRIQPKLAPDADYFGLTDPAGLSRLADRFVANERSSLESVSEVLA